MADTNCTATGATPTRATDDQINAALKTVATGADTRTAAAASNLTLIQQARLSNQKRAATLAVAVFGAGSSQAAAAQKTVTVTTTTAARLAVLTQQANTPAPAVPAAGWVLHGRVYTSSLSAQSGYAVFFVDCNKNYLSNYGYSYTDDTGYFLLSSAGAAGCAPQTGESQTGESQPGQAQAGQSQGATPQLYLQITDAKANPVLLSQTAFVPTTGKATYQSITLPAGDKKLGDLPADIRAVALPDFTATPKQKAPITGQEKTAQEQTDKPS